MIIVKLRGGLGNQMFQYAFGKMLSEKTGNARCIIDASYYRRADRALLIQSFRNSSYFTIGRLGSMLIRKIFRPVTITEKNFSEQDQLPKHIFIEGFWEQWKFPEKIREILEKEFVLKKSSVSFKKHLADLKDKETISVHVRRGDYLIPHGKHLNTKEYYEKGVKKILQEKNLRNPVIIIFSDDKEWCQKEMSELAGHRTTIFNDPSVNTEEELLLMSACRHNVLSNSTFSWWAAFLNSYPEKMIIVPSNWFTDKKLNEQYKQGIIMPNWIIIP